MINTDTFEKSLLSLLPDNKQFTFLLAVSGGVDSMVLCDLLIKTKINFEMAHVNYHLRDAASNLDQQVVEDFSKKHNIKLHIYNVDEKEIPNNSIENWARDIRYKFFRSLLQSRKIDFILTAHHLNDQLESFIINLSKASGLKGLGGIPKNENCVLRPLLDFTKEEIYAYALAENITFREDHTNAENVYLRNKIRNLITPQLLQTNPHFLDNFKKSLGIINDSKAFIDNQIKAILAKISKLENDYLSIDKLMLSTESDFVKFEILKAFGLQSTLEIKKLFEAENGKVFITSSHKIIVGREEFSILALDDVQVNGAIVQPISVTDDKVVFDLDGVDNQSIDWCFDIDEITLPLQLRKPKNEDVFNPKGMLGKKKISKFIKDKKLPIFVRSRIWVLVDAKDQILGVYPYRQDGRFCFKDNGRQPLKVVIKNNEADNVEA